MSETNRQGRLVYDPRVLGDTGLRQSGGYVHEEFLKELQGERGARTYREMADNDAIVGAVIFAVSMLVRNCDWDVQAVDDSPEGEAGKAFVEEVLADMAVPFSTVIGEACSMFVYGYAPMELVWKRRGGPDARDPSSRSAYSDGKIGLRTISLRGQHSTVKWEFDPEDGSVLGLWQQPRARPMVFIPAEKLLLFRTNEERSNPEGRSLLRTAYRSWYFKRRIEEIEAVGIDRDLSGLPVGLVPGSYFSPSADAEEKAILSAWQQLVTRVRRDQQEGILLPSDRDANGNLLFDFKLLSTGGARAFDTSKVVERYNRQIATSVLADFIFLGQQATGSFALSSDKTALFAKAIGGFTRSIADELNRNLLPRLWRLNRLPPDTMPTITPSDLETPNLGEVADYVSRLSGAGAQFFPDRELENRLRQIGGLPLAPEEGLDMDVGAPGANEEEGQGG